MLAALTPKPLTPEPLTPLNSEDDQCGNMQRPIKIAVWRRWPRSSESLHNRTSQPLRADAEIDTHATPTPDLAPAPG